MSVTDSKGCTAVLQLSSRGQVMVGKEVKLVLARWRAGPTDLLQRGGKFYPVPKVVNVCSIYMTVLSASLGSMKAHMQQERAWAEVELGPTTQAPRGRSCTAR